MQATHLLPEYKPSPSLPRSLPTFVPCGRLAHRRTLSLAHTYSIWCGDDFIALGLYREHRQDHDNRNAARLSISLLSQFCRNSTDMYVCAWPAFTSWNVTVHLFFERSLTEWTGVRLIHWSDIHVSFFFQNCHFVRGVTNTKVRLIYRKIWCPCQQEDICFMSNVTSQKQSPLQELISCKNLLAECCAILVWLIRIKMLKSAHWIFTVKIALLCC